MKKSYLLCQQGSPSQGNSTTKVPSKIERILAHLITGNSLNRFEAERLGDHCLNSTISDLANEYSLNVLRRPEKVPNNWGAPCRAVRYSLPHSERDRAELVLEHLQRTKREG